MVGAGIRDGAELTLFGSDTPAVRLHSRSRGAQVYNLRSVRLSSFLFYIESL